MIGTEQYESQRLAQSTGDVYDSPDGTPAIETRRPAARTYSVPDPDEIGGSCECISTSGRLNQSAHDVLVRQLTTAADAVTAALETGLTGALQDQIAEWCALHGFDTPDEPLTQTIIARQAVLNLYLKTTLYEWHHKQGNCPTLPDDVRAALQRAANQTENSAFTEYVLDEVVWLADDAVLTPVIDARHQLLESGDPAEDIGRLYAALMPNERRRSLGQFRTPPQIGTLMRTWATTGEDTVLDPGIGSGALSSPFHPLWDVSAEPGHIDGIDRSQLSLLMGTTALTLARQTHDLQTRDFLEFSPGEVSKSINAIVCNPPYTRHQELPTEYKRAINKQTAREIGLDIDTTSPLYAYFIYHARQFLNTGDRAAIITPHHFLTADYGETLKEFLLDAFDIKALVLYDPEGESQFPGALSTALILFVEAAGEGETSGQTRFIRVDQSPDSGQLLHTVRNGVAERPDWGAVNSLQQDELSPAENWCPLFDPVDIDTSSLTPLSNLAEVSRGLSTGENDFFCLTHREAESRGIAQQYRSPLIRSPRNISGYDVQQVDWERAKEQGETVWLLDGLDDMDGVPNDLLDAVEASTGWPDSTETSTTDDSSAHLVDYLRSGITIHETLQTRTVLRNRSQWYRVPSADPAPILVPYMRRTGFRAVLNDTAALHLNNLHGIYPNDNVDPMEVKALLAYLNSGFADTVVRQHDRTYAGGLDKIEPGDLAELPVLDPRELRDEVVAALAAQFDALRKAARQDDDEDGVVERIDRVLTQEL